MSRANRDEPESPAASHVPALADVIQIEVLQRLVDDLYAVTGIAPGILDMESHVVAAAAWQDICAKFHRVHPETREACRQSDMELSTGLQPGERKYYRCANGLWDAVTPIMVAGQQVGSVVMGQFFFDDEEPDREWFAKRARRFGFDEAEYLAALDRVPHWSRERVDSVMSLLAHLAEMISELSYANTRLEESLRTSARLVETIERHRSEFATLVAHAPDAMVRYDTQLRHVYLNREAEKVVGLSSQECKGRLPSELPVQRETGADMERLLHKVLRDGQAVTVAQEPMTPSGQRYFETTVVPERNEDGEIVSLLVVARDVSKRRKAQLALEESEARARQRAETLTVLSEASVDLLAGQDEEAICRTVGAALRRLLLEARVIVNYASPDGRTLRMGGVQGTAEEIEAAVAILGADPFSLEFPVDELPKRELEDFASGKLRQHKGGIREAAVDAVPADVCLALEELLQVESVWCMGLASRGRIYGSLVLLAPAGTDVPGHQEAIETLVRQGSVALERATSRRNLAASEAQLRAAMDGMDDALHVVDADLRLILGNAAFKSWLERFGLPKDFVGKPLAQICPFLTPEILEEYRRVFQTGEPLVTQEENLVGESVVHTETRRLPILVDGQAPQVVTIVGDVTERVLSEHALRESEQSLDRALAGTVSAMGALVEMRDPYTAGHEQRVTELAMRIADRLGLSDRRKRTLHLAGQVHDVGKIGVPAEILSKPGRLTEMEYDLVREHSRVGYEILASVDFRDPVAEVVRQHHERLDGSGYPQGLKGKDILLEARILAVADVVEAMASHRPYRPSLGVDTALAEIQQGRGTLYDPQVVDACVAVVREEGFVFSD